MSRTRRVPLTGADCFLRAFDAEIARTSGASHVSQLVLRLGPGFDAEVFRKLVDEVVRHQPILRAPVTRRFGLAAPSFDLSRAARCALPPVEITDVEDGPPPGGPLPAVFARRLNERRSLRRGELLRFDVVRYAGGARGTDLAASWLHLLLDGSGSERFLRWLDQCARGDRRPDALPDPHELEPGPPPGRTLGERGAAAREWQRWFEGFAEHPVRSLAGPLRRTPQALECDLLGLSTEETARAAASAGARAGFLTPMLFYLAAAIRAHHAVFRDRGVDPGSYLVPLPVNVRPRGAEGAVFRTHVSLLWFRALPHEVEDLDGLIDVLKAQRLAAIRAGQVQNGNDAMDFARYAPARVYARMARRARGGELCSFFFAYTGEFLSGLDRFLGARIENGFHVAPAPPSPGSCIAMSLREGRLNASHVRQHGVLSDREREIFRDALRADLLIDP